MRDGAGPGRGAHHRRTRLALTVAGVLCSLGLGACTDPATDPAPSPTPTSTSRPFVVMSTDAIRVADPAAVTDAASTVLALNVFQRLMTAEPGQNVLKPDAARDCLFTSATTYTCTLNKKLFFHNGEAVTSRDVKFSIERAIRLNVPGSSASLLSSLRRIETPDELTVRFLLSRMDTQFGWALASPSASIVSSTRYDANRVRPPSAPILGSGPFSVTSFSTTALQLARNPIYVGHDPGQSSVVIYRRAASSAALEEAMTKGIPDVVWRGLDAAAVTRYTQQAVQDELTDSGYRLRSLTGVRVRQLLWSPTSAQRGNAAVRQAVTAALQEDRTLSSDVPGGIPGHIDSFAVGGRGKPRVTWSGRIRLDLGYDPTMPDGRDLATQIRTRLEDTGLSVRLRPGDASADLVLVDRKAWTATALAWLQPYLEAPLPASRAVVTRLQNDYRATTTDDTAAELLAGLQRQAAADSVVLPVSQDDELMWVRDGVEIRETSYGPGWQLGLFGMKSE